MKRRNFFIKFQLDSGFYLIGFHTLVHLLYNGDPTHNFLSSSLDAAIYFEVTLVLHELADIVDNLYYSK